MPATVLRSIITAGLETDRMDLAIGQSVDFMEERLSTLDKVLTFFPGKNIVCLNQSNIWAWNKISGDLSDILRSWMCQVFKLGYIKLDVLIYGLTGFKRRFIGPNQYRR